MSNMSMQPDSQNQFENVLAAFQSAQQTQASHQNKAPRPFVSRENRRQQAQPSWRQPLPEQKQSKESISEKYAAYFLEA